MCLPKESFHSTVAVRVQTWIGCFLVSSGDLDAFPAYVAVSNLFIFAHVVFVQVVATAPMIPQSTQPNCVLRPRMEMLSGAVVGWGTLL